MEAFCNQAKDKPHCHKLSLSRSVCQLRRVMKKCPHACGFCYKGFIHFCTFFAYLGYTYVHGTYAIVVVSVYYLESLPQ